MQEPPRARAKVVCVGMSGLDRIMQVDALPNLPVKLYASGYDEIGGGPAATASVTVQRLGGAASLIGRVGDDQVGEAIRSELLAEGVDLALHRKLPGATSAVSQVVVDAKGERQITHFRGRGLDVDAAWVEPSDLARTDVVLADMGWCRGAERVMKLAAEAGATTVLDADLSADPRAPELLHLAEHVVFSEAALRQMSGLSDPVQGLRWARIRMGGAYIGVTVGPRGYMWLAGETLHSIPGHHVDAVDTLGAGDVFHGAYALALVEGRSVADAARLANAAAAIKCTRPSGRRGIPGRLEVEAWLSRNPLMTA